MSLNFSSSSRLPQFKLAVLLFAVCSLPLSFNCENTGGEGGQAQSAEASSGGGLPYSIFVFKHDNPNKAVKEAEYFAKKGYPCEVYRTTESDYLTAVGGYATQAEADSIFASMPDTIFAQSATPFVGLNTGYLGKIYTHQPPSAGGGAVPLGDYCIPVYNTGNFSDATEFADNLFAKGHYTEVYETSPGDYTVTVGAWTTWDEADYQWRKAINDGIAPRGSEMGSRKAYGTPVYPN